METTLIEILTQFGGIGVASAVFIWIFSKVQADYRERERELTEKLDAIAARFDQTVSQNTEVLARLDEYLKARLG